jgi:hypothetical protein
LLFFWFNRKTKRDREITTIVENSLMRPSGIPPIPPSVRHPIHAVPEHHHVFSKEVSQDNLILPAHPRSEDSVENSPHTILPHQQHPSLPPHPSVTSMPPSLKFPSQVRNEGNLDRNTASDNNGSNQVESGDVSPPNSLQSIHSETSSPTKKLVTSDYFPYEDHTHVETTSPLKDHTHHPHAHRDKNVFSSTLLQSPKGSSSNIFYNNHSTNAGGGKSPLGYARNRNNMTARNRLPNAFPSVSSSLIRGISGGGGGSIILRQPSPGLFHMGSHLSSGGEGGMGSTEDLPSVLLSLLKQQNVDYHNDYYWLEKFHRNKILSKNDFEKSLAEFHQFQQSQLLHPSSSQHQHQQHHQAISSSTATSSVLYPFALQPLQLQRQTSNNSNPDSIPNMNSGSGSGEKPPFPYGVYATNINRNKISSPKLYTRKSYSHENTSSSALKNDSNNNLPVISTSDDALHSLPHSSSSLVPGGISSSSLPSHDLLMNKTNSTSNPLFSTGILQDPSGQYFPFANSLDENDRKPSESDRKDMGGDDNDFGAANEKAILLTKFNAAADKK